MYSKVIQLHLQINLLIPDSQFISVSVDFYGLFPYTCPLHFIMQLKKNIFYVHLEKQRLFFLFFMFVILVHILI